MDTKNEKWTIEAIADTIKEKTGIELTPAEFWKLRIYCQDVKRCIERETCSEFSGTRYYEYETELRFLGDLFGIFCYESHIEKLLGTEEFKEYCKGRVNSWRDERDYL